MLRDDEPLACFHRDHGNQRVIRDRPFVLLRASLVVLPFPVLSVGTHRRMTGVYVPMGREERRSSNTRRALVLLVPFLCGVLGVLRVFCQ